RKPLVLLVFTALAALALIVVALLLATGEPKVTLTTSGTPPTYLRTPPSAHYIRPPSHVQASAAAPIEWMLLFFAAATLSFTAWLWFRRNRSHPPFATA
ncbi:MAG TPA: hypothetical protein VGU02_00030, partial [Gaiellaceae bacterium]|nr:hypothetical protein [Gaiellaceae bacterium]